jgi:hypothetical protein
MKKCLCVCVSEYPEKKYPPQHIEMRAHSPLQKKKVHSAG